MSPLHKRIKSFIYALNGLKLAWQSEVHIRIHTLATVLVLGAGCYYKVSSVEWLALLGCIGLVWVAELINSALEELVDLVSPEWNAKAGKVKDVAAAAVLVASIIAAVIGAMIFIPKVWC
jgi:diacylglycerol kinase